MLNGVPLEPLFFFPDQYLFFRGQFIFKTNLRTNGRSYIYSMNRRPKLPKFDDFILQSKILSIELRHAGAISRSWKLNNESGASMDHNPERATVKMRFPITREIAGQL